MQEGNVHFAMLLTLLAGMSTGVGSLMAFLSRKFSPRFLAASLGFSAGVMIFVSLVDIFPQAKESLIALHGNKLGYWITIAAFFGGIGLISLIDKLVPSFENPHEMGNVAGPPPPESQKLMRMGLFSALAIGIHNFPEGLATFIGALQMPTLGVSIAVAIAIHNIPEGIAVSVPIYYATGSRRKALLLSAASGLAEPIGALIGYLFLRNFLSGEAFGIVFAAVAGIMVFISLDELLPTAEEYGEHHVAIFGLIAGMAVMAASLALFS
ncbi:MAG TPA: zinc transporter ZupT [Fibrobacteraceae bacterium]|nr:zinc transporter ZupT [Fibrobacteraceae bacterium]